MMTCWQEMIEDDMKQYGESWTDVVAEVVAKQERWLEDEDCYPTDPEMHHPPPSLGRKFDDGYGGPEGCWFTVWTTNRVYFPTVYDGAESVRSVPRNPCEEATPHVGGW